MIAAPAPSADVPRPPAIVTAERKTHLTRAWQSRPALLDCVLCWPCTDGVARSICQRSCILPHDGVNEFPEKLHLRVIKQSLPSFVSYVQPSYLYRPSKLVNVDDDRMEFALILALNWADRHLPEPDLVDKIADELFLEGLEREPRWRTLVSPWKAIH